MLLTFDAAAVARLCPYDRLVDALALGLREPIVSPARMHLDPPGDGSAFLIMPAWQTGGLIGVKMVSVWPANAKVGKPTVTALYNVFSCTDGMPVAVIDGTELTLRRTAAAAALGARLLARKGRLRLAVLGTGALAPAHWHRRWPRRTSVCSISSASPSGADGRTRRNVWLKRWPGAVLPLLLRPIWSARWPRPM